MQETLTREVTFILCSLQGYTVRGGGIPDYCEGQWVPWNSVCCGDTHKGVSLCF